MSISAYIMTQIGDQTSDSFKALPGDLDCAITEIRIEEHLDKPATFAIRFQEDFEDGEGKTFTAADLRGAKGMAIAVSSGPGPAVEGLGKAKLPAAEELVCLIRGQIENSQADLSPGGSGSTLEVRGRDLRTIIDRANKQQEFSGPSEDIFKEMITMIGSAKHEVDSSAVEYSGNTKFTYVGTVLDGLDRLATLCNHSVWLRYELKKSGAGYDVTPTVHVKTSPERGNLKSPADLDLKPGDKNATMRIMGDEKVCETVINFSHKTDTEAVACVKVAGVDHETGEAYEGDQGPDHDNTTEGGEDATNAGAEDCDRTMFVATSGGADRTGSTAQAAVNDASWYVKASALTTVHMLGTVLRPHDIVMVSGGGCGISGGFQVEKVTHVLNAAAHWMQVDLRSNSRSIEAPQKGPSDV